MKEESQYERSLRLIEKFFKETPKEEIDKILAEIDVMKIEGPTIDEYLDGLQRELTKWQKTVGG